MNFQYLFRHGVTSFVITEGPRKSCGRDCQKYIHSDLLSVQRIDGGNGGGPQPPPVILNNN